MFLVVIFLLLLLFIFFYSIYMFFKKNQQSKNSKILNDDNKQDFVISIITKQIEIAILTYYGKVITPDGWKSILEFCKDDIFINAYIWGFADMTCQYNKISEQDSLLFIISVFITFYKDYEDGSKVVSWLLDNHQDNTIINARQEGFEECKKMIFEENYAPISLWYYITQCLPEKNEENETNQTY